MLFIPRKKRTPQIKFVGGSTIKRCGLHSYHCAIEVKWQSCPGAKLIKHHAMKRYGGSGSTIPPFLTSALDGGEWSASRPLYLREKRGRRLGGPHSRYGYCGVEKNILPLPEIEP
jgi:hypothetical protein